MYPVFYFSLLFFLNSFTLLFIYLFIIFLKKTKQIYLKIKNNNNKI